MCCIAERIRACCSLAFCLTSLRSSCCRAFTAATSRERAAVVCVGQLPLLLPHLRRKGARRPCDSCACALLPCHPCARPDPAPCPKTFLSAWCACWRIAYGARRHVSAKRGVRAGASPTCMVRAGTYAQLGKKEGARQPRDTPVPAPLRGPRTRPDPAPRPYVLFLTNCLVCVLVRRA